MQIFIGNLPYTATEDDIKKLFETYGTVASVSLKKKSGGNARGFGFLDMPDDTQARAAIAGLNEKDFMGRALVAMPKRAGFEKPRKDYKEIKRKRREAKLLPVAPLVIKDDVPEVKARPTTTAYHSAPGAGGVKKWQKRPEQGRERSEGRTRSAAPARASENKPWEKKSTGKTIGWKPKPSFEPRKSATRREERTGPTREGRTESKPWGNKSTGKTIGWKPKPAYEPRTSSAPRSTSSDSRPKSFSPRPTSSAPRPKSFTPRPDTRSAAPASKYAPRKSAPDTRTTRPTKLMPIRSSDSKPWVKKSGSSKPGSWAPKPGVVKKTFRPS